MNDPQQHLRTEPVKQIRTMDGIWALVHRFLDLNPEWGEVNEDTGGEGLCFPASEDLRELFAKCWPGSARVESLCEVAGFRTYCGGDCHWVLVVDGCVVVDLTARQFDEFLPFPHVWVLP